MIPLTQPQIADAIYRVYEKRRDEQKPRAYLGGSAIGQKCLRALWYDFRKVLLPEFEGRLLRLFETGHREEDRMIADLQAAGLEVHGANPKTGEQFEVTAFGGHFKGHFDGLLRGVPDAPQQWHLLETKTSNTKKFDQLEEQGVKEVKPVHWAQMQVYMGLAPTRWESWGLDGDPPKAALYMVHCKEDERLYLERVHFDEAAFFEFGEKAKSVIEATAPPEPISFVPEYYLCEWCDYAEVCHGTRLARFDCRTCIHSTPDMERGWICERHDGPLGDFGGCPDHLYLPPLLQNIAGDVVNYDREEPCDWIEYDQDGVRIRNVTGRADVDGVLSYKMAKGAA